MGTGEGKGKKQSGEEGASSGAASGAEDKVLNAKDLNFLGEASVIECAAVLLLKQLQIVSNDSCCQARGVIEKVLQVSSAIVKGVAALLHDPVSWEL